MEERRRPSVRYPFFELPSAERGLNPFRSFFFIFILFFSFFFFPTRSLAERKIVEVEQSVVIPKNTPGRKRFVSGTRVPFSFLVLCCGSILLANNNRKLNDTESGDNVDPDEPVYCVCRQVSFGEMVACDDSQVCFEADLKKAEG